MGLGGKAPGSKSRVRGRNLEGHVMENMFIGKKGEGHGDGQGVRTVKGKAKGLDKGHRQGKCWNLIPC